MPEPSKQAVEEASEFFPAEWSEQEARAKAANVLQAAYAIDYPALLEQARSEVEGEVRERLNSMLRWADEREQEHETKAGYSGMHAERAFAYRSIVGRINAELSA